MRFLENGSRPQPPTSRQLYSLAALHIVNLVETSPHTLCGSRADIWAALVCGSWCSLWVSSICGRNISFTLWQSYSPFAKSTQWNRCQKVNVANLFDNVAKTSALQPLFVASNTHTHTHSWGKQHSLGVEQHSSKSALWLVSFCSTFSSERTFDIFFWTLPRMPTQD